MAKGKGGNWVGVSLGAVSLCGGYATKCVDHGWFEKTRCTKQAMVCKI